MATNYPNSLDSLTNPTTTDPVNNPSHAVQHANANDAIEALQSKVGTNNSAVATSLDYRVKQLELNPLTSTVSISSLADKDLLTYDSATGLWKNKTFTTLDIPTKTYVDTALSNLSNTVTTDYVPISDVGQVDGVASLDSTGKIPLAQMGNLIDGAPTALDTLNELAAALGDNPNYATDITTALGTKVSKNGGDTITTSSTSTIPLKIKDITSQSVSTQEWLRSDNTPYAWMANGTNTGTVNFQTGVIRASSNLVAGYQVTGGQSAGFNAASNSAMGQVNWNTGLYTLYLRNASEQTADSLRIESSSGVPLAKITADGSSYFDISGNGTTNAGNALVVGSAYGVPRYGAAMLSVGAVGNVGIVVRGSSTQSQKLQEWQNSSGTAVASMDVSGKLIVPTLRGPAGSVITLGTDGQPYSLSISNTQFDSYGPVPWRPYNTSMVGFIIKGLASQTADLQQWQNSSGTVLAKIDKDGNFISSYATSSILAGGGRAIIDAYGAIYTLDTLTVGSTSDRFAPGAVSIIHRSGNTTHTTVGIKGMASQTGDLTQWQNSAGTVLAKITSTGAFDATAITVNGQPVSGGAQYQTTAPSSPTVGQIWIDSDDDIEAFDLTNKKTEIPASISANTNLVAGRRYFVTSASALTLTLPASPALNDEIQILDASGNASTYNITVARNGNKINGGTGNLIIDTNGGWYTLVYTGSTYGWKVG